jgi:hypothetical protein
MLKTESFEFKDPRKPKIPNPMIWNFTSFKIQKPRDSREGSVMGRRRWKQIVFCKAEGDLEDFPL